MPINVEEATKVINKEMPAGKIQAVIVYRNLYLFAVFTDDPFEVDWDPFVSVNRDTGEFRDFSIFADGDAAEILRLFETAKAKGG